MTGSVGDLQRKQQIRGGATVEFLEEDIGGMKMEKLLCLNSGTQSFLNRSFAASKAVTEYTDLLTLVPLSSDVPASDEQTGKREECIRKNLNFIRG